MNEDSRLVSQTAGSEESLAQGAFVAAAVLFLLGAIRFAWVSDDAFITLRVVDNVTHGFGAVVNEGSRVQAFTHPLWFLLLIPIHFVTKEGYTTLLAANLICAAGLVAVLRWGMSAMPAAITLLLLSASYSYLSFSTSGLENPLAFVLLALFSLLALREGSLLSLWFTGGLVVLSRFDLVLLVAPTLAWTLRSITRRELARAALCLLPLVLWLVFSTVYYGSPLPNTAFAKLNLDVSRPGLLAQGGAYLIMSATVDPIIVFLLCLGVAALFVLGARGRALGVGVVLYLAYVVWIGGDFMAGRALTAPATIAAVGLGSWVYRQLHAGPRTPILLSAAGLVSLFLAANTVLLSSVPQNPKTRCVVPSTGVVDERKCYYEHTALSQNNRTLRYKEHPYYREGLEWRADEENALQVSSLVGLGGYAAGPRVTIIDPYALADPLLARLPFSPEGGWRIGHFFRPLPRGYRETRRTGVNVIEDPCIRALWDDVRLASEGDLFSVERLRALYRLNTGVHRCQSQPKRQ